MTRDNAYYIGTNLHSFRPNIPAEIVGVEWVSPVEKESRLCYHIRWADSTEDWAPISDSENYKIITFQDILNNNL